MNYIKIAMSALALAGLAAAPSRAETSEAVAQLAEVSVPQATQVVAVNAADDKASAKDRTGVDNLRDLGRDLRAGKPGAFRRFFRAEARRNVDWSNHPCKPGEVRDTTQGDSGVVCRSAQRFTVSCDVTSHQVPGEGGPQTVVDHINSCTCNGKPCNGFAGDGPGNPDTPQAP